MSRAVTWLLAVVSVAALAVTLPTLLGGLGPSSPSVPVATVTRGDFVRTVEAEGNLEAAEATLLASPIDIELPLKVAWLAEDGSRVKTGDVVCRFDPSDMEKDLADGRADRRSAESKIEQTRLTGDATVKNLARDADMARLELDHAREFQSKDTQIFSRSEIIESEIDEGLAEAREDHAMDLRSIHGDLSDVSVDLLEIEKRKAQLKIDRAERGLDALELTAPHDGIFVVHDTWQGPLQVGALVWRGNPIGEIPRLDEMEAKIYVLEADAGGLAPDLAATVALEAHPGKTFAATVIQVDALPNPRVRQTPVQYFAAKLRLERTDPELMKPGQRVRALIRLNELQDVLTVPREAVFEKDGKSFAWRRNGSGFEAVEVTLGPAGLGRVVVESGLDEGDRVALGDPTRPSREGSGEEEGEAGNGPVGGVLG